MTKTVTVTWADVAQKDGGPIMPAHLAEWGETPQTWDRWQAWWKIDGSERWLWLKGSPLGRAHTRDAAVADLLWRTERESGVKIVGLEGPRPE